MSLHLPDPYLHAATLQSLFEFADLCVPVMVGVQDFRREHPCSVGRLGNGHCIGLVDREEGDVYVFEILQLRDVFRVAGYIDTRAA